MTKEVLFPLFDAWKRMNKYNYPNVDGKTLWKIFVKDLEKYNIINIWKEEYNENDIRKKLGLTHIDENGWTISKSRIANGKTISFKLKEIYNNEEEIKKQENKNE